MLAGLDALSRLAPRRHGSRHTNGALALAAAVRVIAGVHNYAADTGTHAHVANAAGLTEAYVLVVAVADLADGGASVDAEPCELRRRADEPERTPFSLAIS